MSPAKRQHDGMLKDYKPQLSPFIYMFERFKGELDEHYDRRERIIKASRDITSLSKKIIFSLQRVRAVKQCIPPIIDVDIKERFSAIKDLFKGVSDDLQGINTWRYQRQISPGIQEYIEAISFEFYIRYQTLITLDHASNGICGGITLTTDDYILGIFDLTGELMRFAITAMATTGSVPGSKLAQVSDDRTVLMDLQTLRMYLEGLDPDLHGATGLGKDFEKKIDVMRVCVEKVETAVYGMIIRGQERPKGWMPDVEDHGSGDL